MNALLARLWRKIRGSYQWRLLWFAHAKFNCGVTGVVLVPGGPGGPVGRVLLLRHRLWPLDRQWGFPTGYARKGERHEDTIAREVREETGLSVEVGRLLKVTSGYRLRIEIAYEAVLTDGAAGMDGLRLEDREILEARLFPLDGLPEGMLPAHRELLALALERTQAR
ncbi:NUDIX domain-containing protein [Actinocorallia sp. B10E7]|uniref:NUDIX domain-containing protein n=1 Tax=Actinocorallia sp. B10E7 TaxID=3153558 RepID=UPI00325C87AA